MRAPSYLPPALGALDRTLVMGVVNTTPDSFSDGGRYLDSSAAIEHARLLHDQGADLIDIGGESTRPGASRITAEQEQARVLPVIAALSADGIHVSIDTMRASTAAAAVAVGACMVNDVSGGQADPEMTATVAGLRVPYVIMHWRGHSSQMQNLASYADVTAEVLAELRESVESAVAAGIDRDCIVLDPGLGFAKDADHNWTLLRDFDQFTSSGFPILVGASRKRFLGALLADDNGEPRLVEDRDDATDAVSAIAAALGAWAVRVHDVRGSRDAVMVAAAWNRGSGA